MSTAASWTDTARREARSSLVDVAHLVRFRVGTLPRRTLRGGLVAVLTVTAGSAALPAWAPGAGDPDGRAGDLLLLLGTGLTSFLLLGVLAAVTGGGGRELIARDHAAAYPVGPTTDHLGALLLAPLTIAWLLQAWLLLGATAYTLGPRPLLVSAQVVVVLWLLAATAVAQVVGWSLEAVRRGPHGIRLVRALGLAVVLGVTGLVVTDRLLPLLDASPTTVVVIGLASPPGVRWGLTVAGLLLAALVAVALGAVPAHLAARRLPADEARAETGIHRARPAPRSDLAALVRLDRASVWRAVPTRRGVLVLAGGPGLVAVLGDLPWESVTILPGLVASGAALLFGVNAWCLDERGALWRESLPVDPGTVFAARALVLAELLLVGSLATVALAATRAGVPTPGEAAAVAATLTVVMVQVVGASMRWSAAHPYPADLRSARATPAPPLAMVGYSARLALATTLTGVLFSLLARLPGWHVPLLVAVPMLCWSLARLARQHRAWADPVVRARVVGAVAG